MNLIKRCRVCGDQATGFNYNGLCCESCKVFFHRNAAHEKKFKCKRNNECLIDITSRKLCRKCRLEKCFQNGMKLPEVKNNDTQQLVPVQDNLNRYNSIQFIENLFTNDTLVKLIYESNFEPNLANMDGGNTKRRFAIKLTEYEQTRVDEILNAVDVFVDEWSLPLVGQSRQIYDSIDSIEMYTRMIIQYCKRIPAFAQLSPADQFVILKPFCFDIMMIRCSHLYDKERNGFPVLLENKKETIFMNCDIWFKVGLEHQNLMNKNYNFMKELNVEMEGDTKIRDLLTSFTMFRHLTKMSCPEFVRYNFMAYSRLLRRYLENKYQNVHQANRKYLKLIKFVENFEKIKQNERIWFKQLDRARIPQLCVELFDL